MKWKGAGSALAVAAAVAGVAIGLTVGGGGSSSTGGVGSTGAVGSTGGSSSSTSGARVKTSGSTAARSPSATTEVAGIVQTVPSKSQVGTVIRKGQRAQFGHRLLVGTVDDSFKQSNPDLAAAAAQASHDAGFDTVLVSSMWTRGTTAPSADEREALEVALAAARKQRLRVLVFVWHGLSGGTPRTPAARRQFAGYAGALARAFPALDAIVVGNEPNLNTFWMPQFGRDGSNVAATGYYDLLARSYDAIKAAAPRTRVIGGALAPRGSDRPQLKRHTHSPTQFIKDLGAAYRASGRAKPIMDGFAIHPYMRTSALPPTETHADSTTITIADYPKLVSLLTQAFRGTAQRGRSLPVYYTEFGVQTKVPASHRHAYTQLASAAGLDAVDPATQAKYYRQALLMTACQASVRGLFVFHTFDEQDLRGWQSGLYYADRQPKTSLPSFRRAATLAQTARLTRCAGGTFVRTR